MTDQAITLLTALFVAHFLGDFTALSTPRMLEAKAGKGSIDLIAGHALVHGGLVALAVLVAARPGAALVALAAGIEFVAHFLIDAGRARLCVLRPSLQDPGGKPFWTALGADQLLHGVVLIGIAGVVL